MIAFTQYCSKVYDHQSQMVLWNYNKFTIVYICNDGSTLFNTETVVIWNVEASEFQLCLAVLNKEEIFDAIW